MPSACLGSGLWMKSSFRTQRVDAEGFVVAVSILYVVYHPDIHECMVFRQYSKIQNLRPSPNEVPLTSLGAPYV